MGYVTGFFANRNATADLLLAGVVAVAGVSALRLVPLRGTARGLAVGGAIALLSLSAVLTGSRTGTLLLVPVLLVSLPLAFGLRLASLRRTRLLLTAAAGAAAVAALVLTNPVIGRTWERFGATQDARSSLWADSRHAAEELWPWGGGMGTFVPLFISAEELNAVDSSFPIVRTTIIWNWRSSPARPG